MTEDSTLKCCVNRPAALLCLLSDIPFNCNGIIDSLLNKAGQDSICRVFLVAVTRTAARVDSSHTVYGQTFELYHRRFPLSAVAAPHGMQWGLWGQRLQSTGTRHGIQTHVVCLCTNGRRQFVPRAARPQRLHPYALRMEAVFLRNIDSPTHTTRWHLGTDVTFSHKYPICRRHNCNSCVVLELVSHYKNMKSRDHIARPVCVGSCQRCDV